MEPAGNARPVEPPLPAENPWGNPIRWSCLKIPCHCAFHLRFPRGKTLWIGVYRPPPTPGSHGCDSPPASWSASRGGLRSGVLDGLLVCAYARASVLEGVIGLRLRSTTPVDGPLPARQHGRPGPREKTVRSDRFSAGEQTAEPVGKGPRGRARVDGRHQSAGRYRVGSGAGPEARARPGRGGVRSGRRRAEPKPYGRPKARIPRVGADEQPGPNPDLSATAEAGCPNLSIPPKPARRP